MIGYALAAIFAAMTVSYYYVTFSEDLFSSIFLTISTFLFAIFSGFFMARQSARYSQMREQITKFDGDMSVIYRNFGHIGTKAQAAAGAIIKKHYRAVMREENWASLFSKKTDTIISLHELIKKQVGTKELRSRKYLGLQGTMAALERLQATRKNILALQVERIPRHQWILLYFLAIILLFALATIPSAEPLYGALIKGAFATCIILILILLHEFDRFRFFEETLGKESSKDVIEIIKGKR